MKLYINIKKIFLDISDEQKKKKKQQRKCEEV